MTDDIATIREALDKPWCPNLGNTSPEMHSGCSYCADHQDAVAALDRVAARLAELHERNVRLETQELVDALDMRDVALEQAERERDSVLGTLAKMREQAEAAEARARELTDALEDYGRHERGCDSNRAKWVGENPDGFLPCSCGFDAALAAHAKEPAWGPDHPSYDEMGQ